MIPWIVNGTLSVNQLIKLRRIFTLTDDFHIEKYTDLVQDTNLICRLFQRIMLTFAFVLLFYFRPNHVTVLPLSRLFAPNLASSNFSFFKNTTLTNEVRKEFKS